MTLQQLQQSIGQVQRRAAQIEKNLFHADRIADICGHPDQAKAAKEGRALRIILSRTFTDLHYLEARLPTPELLSERAYNRMIALGFEVEAAEAERCTTYRAATKASRKPYVKTKAKAQALGFAHLTPTSFFN